MIVIKRKGQTIVGSPPEVQQPHSSAERPGEPADPPSEPLGRAADEREDAPSPGGGRGNPPSHTRFKPGQSGNPKGRPKGSRSLAQEIQRQMQKTAVVMIDGKPKRRTFREMSAQQVTHASAKGSLRAFEVAAKYEAQTLASEPAPRASVETLALDDDAYRRIHERLTRRLAKIDSNGTK
jgi:Family of unknown function (DUF5681)